YPRLLRVASDPPWVLYVWGELRPEDVLAIAVVGSRRATRHGLEVASGIGRGLAASGFTIVSGLARGIDAAGHKCALEGGGRSLAGTRAAGPRDTGVAPSAAPLLSGPGAVPCDVQALTPEERRVLSRVPKTRGIGIERLGVACGLPPGTLLAVLLELELRGLVRQLPGRRFTSAACKF